MMFFLILAPFIAFAFLLNVSTVEISIAAATLIAFGVNALDLLQKRKIKMLTGGTLVTFALIGAYLLIVDRHPSQIAIRLAVDIGVLVIALGSMAIRSPFTLQYAREHVEPHVLRMPSFMTTNYVLTWAWTGAFVLMLLADIATIYFPGMPLWLGVLVAFAARNAAVFFTKWYPKHHREKLVSSVIATSSRS